MVASVPIPKRSINPIKSASFKSLGGVVRPSFNRISSGWIDWPSSKWGISFGLTSPLPHLLHVVNELPVDFQEIVLKGARALQIKLLLLDGQLDLGFLVHGVLRAAGNEVPANQVVDAELVAHAIAREPLDRVNRRMRLVVAVAGSRSPE